MNAQLRGMRQIRAEPLTLANMSSLYDVPLKTLDGRPASLRDYAGKVLLIVNVASRCGLTPQYAGLQTLYQRFRDRGFVVLGFPSNDFAGQEPGSAEEIQAFCATDFPVTFPLFEKIPVSGESKHPVYSTLTAAMPWHEFDAHDFRDNIDNYLSLQGLDKSPPLPEVLWNFEKFLVGRDGDVLARFSPDVQPDSPRLVNAVEKALGS
jgi:glutathione peroxidase